MWCGGFHQISFPVSLCVGGVLPTGWVVSAGRYVGVGGRYKAVKGAFLLLALVSRYGVGRTPWRP